MKGLQIRSLLVVLFLIVLPSFYGVSASHGISVACMMEYDKGGAPAVFKSLECPQWKPSAGSQNYTGKCQFYTLQGHRQYQEDRGVCDLNMKIPFLGKNGLGEVTVGIVAIFDGHGGKEASEMASELLFDYFYLHTLFNIQKLMALHKGDLSASDYESLHLEILKEALLQTLHDIDSKFTKEALKNRFFSGSTATVVLLVDGKILVANVGDSKALLLEKTLFGQGAEGNSKIHLSATELTKDHHPDRDDERARIEAAGGSVIVWGVPRVNGVLAMSRSIGDVYLKKYGVIAVPEFTGWRHLTANDRYLVVASDGLFESLIPQDISDLIWKWESHTTSCLSSVVECIVKAAYERGSKDNISAIVVSLR